MSEYYHEQKSNVTSNDAWQLERYRRGGPALDLSRLTSSHAVAMGRTMLENPRNRDGALNAYIAMLPGPVASAIMTALTSVDPTRPLSRGKKVGSLPPLPARALQGMTPEEWLAAREAEAGCRAGAWVDTYMAYARAISPMSDDLFHESAALFLISLAIVRRLHVPLPHMRLYPNLYILWVARSGVYHKSTSLRIAEGIAQRLFPHLLGAHDTTYEALIHDMAGMEPIGLAELPGVDQAAWKRRRDHAAQFGIIVDEFSGLMAGTTRDYSAGLPETYLLGYDCKDELRRSTKGTGIMRARYIYISILGASTPSMLNQYLNTPRLWANGWWPRFTLLAPPEDRPAWATPSHTMEPPELADRLQHLYARLPRPEWPNAPQSYPLIFAPGVEEDLESLNRAVHEDLNATVEEDLAGFYSRLRDHMLKVAILLAAIDWHDSAGPPTIGRHHLARAICIVEGWRASVHRVRDRALGGGAQHLEERVLGVLGRELAGVTFRDLSRSMASVNVQGLRSVLQDLMDAGQVIVTRAAPGPRGGRATERYLLNALADD